MARFVKGVSGNPSGRPKGAKNKKTHKLIEAYHRLLDDNAENMQKWLEEVAEENPKQALEIMMKLSEYLIPKLARKELTAADGEELFKNARFKFGEPDKKEE